MRFVQIAVVLLGAWSLPACARTEGANPEAAVLLERYETVFYVSQGGLGDLYKAKSDGSKSRVMLASPFVRLIGSFAGLRGGVAKAVLGDAKAILVGAKDFRPPRSTTGLGFVQSTFCFIVMGAGDVDLGAMGAEADQDVLGRPAWTWRISEGESGQMALYSSRIDRGRLLVCSDQTELRAVASALVSNREPRLDEEIMRARAALSSSAIWGLRLVRGRSLPWEPDLLERCNRLEYRADTANGGWSLRVVGRSGLEYGDLIRAFPGDGVQWRSVGLKQWELAGKADNSSGQSEALFAAMGLMGFGAFL